MHTATGADLVPGLRARIDIAVAALHECDGCLSALVEAARAAGVDDDEIALARAGHSPDPRYELALTFATKLVRQRGYVPARLNRALDAAGFGAEERRRIARAVAAATSAAYVELIDARG